LGKPPWHDAVPLLQRLIFNCIVTAERSEGGKVGGTKSKDPVLKALGVSCRNACHFEGKSSSQRHVSN
jgi:hypothetical protein